MHAAARPRRIALASAALVGVGLACVPFAGKLVPRGADWMAATAIFICSLALFATGAVLLALFARAPRRSTAFLAATYIGAALLSAAQALTLPIGPAASAVIPAAFAVAPWFYVAWHLGFCLCAATYFAMRWRPEPVLRPPDGARVAVATVAVFVTAAVLLAGAILAAGDHLPRFVGTGGTSPFVSSGFGPAVFAACFLATVVAVAWRDPDEIDAALIVSLVALTVDIGLHVVTDHRFVVAWYAARLFALLGSSLVLVAAIRGLLAWRDRALQLETLLADEMRTADRHARRLELLWRIGSSTGDDDTFLAELLAAAATVIVEGQQLYGLLAHLEGVEMVVDLARDADNPDVAATGGRYPIEESILGIVLREGKTTSWPDIRRDPRFDVRRLDRVPWRASIGTTFRVAQTIYYVGFAGTAPLAAPFGPLDHAYVETLASFCAARLQRRAQVDRMRYQTEHDALTGMLSRATFRARGFAALREQQRTALAIVDIDRFRELNDTIGSFAADAVLVEVAAALERAAPRGDLIGRLGGDTFGILLPAAGDLAQTEAQVARYFAIFEQPFGAGNARAEFLITATIGVAKAPEDGTSFEQILARADTAVYAAKAAGGARCTFFERRFEDAYTQVRRLQNELAEALVRGEFVLHFQPHIEFATGSVIGAEALIRWDHPGRGLLMPSDFVPFAEEHGMMGAIGGWVMSETVRRSAGWRAADEGFRVWFNMSAAELADPALSERLRGGGGAVRGVGVEITETVAMQDVHETLRNADRLRAAGFAIALDDFGTGYSSLARLKRLPIDVVKIDQAFTAGVPGDAHDEAIVGAVLEIAKRFGFEAVAEGVETAQQIAWLRAAGCRFGQGYAFAHPMPAEDFDRWLAERRNSGSGRAYMRA
jgi:diguanylate cyclase (GGDEF)-like protein